MFVKTQSIAVIAACVLAAEAQSSGASPTLTTPASLPSLDSCILNCITQAASSGGCSSYTDLSCVCTSLAFQSAALQCLQTTCSADDVSVATQLQAQECAPLLGSSTPAPSNTETVSSNEPSNTAETSSSSPSNTAETSSGAPSATNTSSTNAALRHSVPFSFENTFGTLVASAGALLGAAFVL